MKKFTIFLVAVLTVATLAGCGSTNQTADNTNVTNETSTTHSQTVELKDTTSGVAINGKVGTGTQIEAKTISSGTDYDKTKEYVDTLGDDIAFNVYDISLLDKDKAKVQPDGTVEVKVKLSDELKNAAGNAFVVFYISGSDFSKLSCTEKDGYVTFQTNHFSIYTVCKYDLTDEKASEKIDEIVEEKIPEMVVEDTNNNGSNNESSNGKTNEIPTNEVANNDVPSSEKQDAGTSSQTEAAKEPETEAPTSAPVQDTTPETQAPTVPETEAPTEKHYDGYDEFGNGYVIKTDSIGCTDYYFEANNPYTLDQFTWTDDGACLKITKDVGTQAVTGQYEFFVDSGLQKTMHDKFFEQTKSGYTDSGTVYGNYNGHWIVEYRTYLMELDDIYM